MVTLLFTIATTFAGEDFVLRLTVLDVPLSRRHRFRGCPGQARLDMFGPAARFRPAARKDFCMRTRLGAVMFTGAMSLAPALATVPASATPANPAVVSGEIASRGSSSTLVSFLCFLQDLHETLSAEAGSNCAFG
jgi:hypothetical protein